MGNLFGVRRRAPAVTVTPQDRAILQLKQQRDKIKIYQNRIESQLEIERQLAIKLLKNNMKERALVILRKKKFMEDILNRTDGQLATLEQLVHDIEFSQIEVSVVEGLKAGSEALKQLNSVMSIENVQQILEENEEAAEKQKEISRLLSGTQRYEEEELMKDLEGYSVTDKLNVTIEIPKTEPKEEHEINSVTFYEDTPSRTVEEAMDDGDASNQVEPHTDDSKLGILDELSTPSHDPNDEIEKENSKISAKKESQTKIRRPMLAE